MSDRASSLARPIIETRRATAQSNGTEMKICAYRAPSYVDGRLGAHKAVADLPVHKQSGGERGRLSRGCAGAGSESAGVGEQAMARSNGTEP